MTDQLTERYSLRGELIMFTYYGPNRAHNHSQRNQRSSNVRKMGSDGH